MKVYAIKDKRTNEYEKDLVIRAHMAEAVRLFEEVSNNPETKLHKWPLDFQLDELGEMNMKTGEVTHQVKEICQIMDLIKKETRPIIDPVQEPRPQMNQ